MRRSNMAEHAEYLAQSMGFDSPTIFPKRRCPRQADLECNLEAIGLFILSAVLPGTVTVGTAAAATGVLGVVTGVTATAVGGLAVAGAVTGVVSAANQMGQASGKSKAYNEMAESIQTSAVTDGSVGGISDEDMRRRAQLANAKNNTTNVLSTESDSSDSTLKSTLGGTDLGTTAVIGNNSVLATA